MKQPSPLLSFLTLLLTVVAHNVSATTTTSSSSSSSSSAVRSYRSVAFIGRGGGGFGDEIPKVTTTEVQTEEDNDDDMDEDESPQQEQNNSGYRVECVGGACSIRGGAAGVGEEEEYEEYEDEVFEDAVEELEEVDGESYIYEDADVEAEEENLESDVEVEQEEVKTKDEEVEDSVNDAAGEEGVEEFAFQPDVILQRYDDGDSSAFVDRDELADAYDDDEMVLGSTSFRAGHTDEDDRASIDDVPGAAEPDAAAAAAIGDFEGTETQDAVEPDAENESQQETVAEPTEPAELPVEQPPNQPTGITDEVKAILIEECGFRKSELRGMKPAIALVMAEKRLRRPLEGIPPSWYEEKKKGNAMAIWRKVLTAAIPVALGALAAYGGADVKKLLFSLKSKSELLVGELQDKLPSKDNGDLTVPSSDSDSFEEEPVAVAVAGAAEEEPKKQEEPKKARSMFGRAMKRGGAQSVVSTLDTRMNGVEDCRTKLIVRKN